MAWRLFVIDGADASRFFPLPAAGATVIGNSHKFTDVCLNDLYVARVHCQIETEQDQVAVVALAEDRDTLVNGQKIRQHHLQPGDVLRIGNTQMRLEPDDGSRPDPDRGVAKPAEELPELEWDQLEQLTGHTLGHFEIGPMLGRGHHGLVFRARDKQARQEVALKVLGPDFPADKAELKHFAETIKAVAEIQEEHLVRWFSAGKTAWYTWISQELIEGDSLAQIMERDESTAKVKWRNALKIAQDIGHALDCLYKRHIVHGNLTPANTLVAMDRTAKLNDLMFEQAMDKSQWHLEVLEGKLLSELPYLAPERLEENAYWDSLADMYSLGVIVYQRLTGRLPFKGKTPGDTIELIRESKPAMPRKLVGDVPEAFQNLVLKLLKRNQEDRYQTPAELLAALEKIEGMS
ncbi:MAG TPA: FHA domain-containing serine/threonine-protein kinase [Gemmataceae bacterium]|nr:FHA domain-containing serine/threonine-protein kinase [Gemmataceae bacterium]